MMNILSSGLAVAVLVAAGAGGADGFVLKDHGGSLDVSCNGRLVARYMCEHDTNSAARRVETYKPYLHVFNTEGTAPITKGPRGQFPHHRGIFLGWKVSVGGKTYDRWHMSGGDQVHEKFLRVAGGADGGSFTSLVKWMGDKDAVILEEERTVSFLPSQAGSYATIDVVAKLKAVAGEAKVDGDPEHAGIQFRPAIEIDASKTTYFFPVAQPDPKKQRDYPWFAETMVISGQTYSVVFLNHPSNPTNAAISAYRNYGRFGLFPKFVIPAGGAQEVRARFLVCAGAVPAAELIQKAWNDYAGRNESVPPMSERKADGAASPAPKKKEEPKKTTQVECEDDRPSRERNYALHKSNAGPEEFEIKFKLPTPEPLSVGEALKTFALPNGFKIEAVAAEPMIQAPVAVSWDDQARMYVCEMRGYMHDVEGSTEDQPLGRISRLEDTDGDGIYDKSTVFVDKLVMPRAVMALGDGALVGEPPQLRWYRDLDGDGVADTNSVVMSNFGTRGGQPEHMVNSPTWTLENWIAMTKGSGRLKFQGGAFISDSIPTQGQWGLAQDDWGRLYFNYNSDLLRGDMIPPAYFARNPAMAGTTRAALNVKVLADQSVWPSHPTPGVNRGYNKGQLRDDGTLATATGTCGAHIYRGDLFPAEFQGNAFIPEPCGNLVKRVILSESNGVVSAKNAYEKKDFLTSTDERFRPVNAYTGPDGALYIVDLARGIVQHKSFLTHYNIANIKDRKLEAPVNLGRIWRISPEGAKPKAVKLPRDAAAIAPLLAHPNGCVRDTAQRVLVERGDKDSVDAIKPVAKDAALPQSRAQALWTLHGIGALTNEVVSARLSDKDPHVRAIAARLADRTLAAEVAKLADDSDAAVRTSAALALSTMPGHEAALVKILQQGGGPYRAEAVASGLRGRELDFLALLLKEPEVKKDEVVTSGILPILSACVMKDRRSAGIARLLELIAAQTPGGARQLALLDGLVVKSSSKTPPPVKLVYLDAEPASLAALKKSASGNAKTAITALDATLAWPGKPGVPPPPVVKPLTADEQKLFEQGKAAYALCAACHQPNGAGLDGLAPPLVDSEWVLGPPDRSIRIILNGLTGPITVGGVTWRLEMPPLGALPDETIAAILTYIRREWEHTASPVSRADVTKVRTALAGRASAWTADELKKPFPAK